VFVGFSHIFLLRILIFKGLTARRLYKSFGVKGLNSTEEFKAEFYTIPFRIFSRFVAIKLHESAQFETKLTC
jgi:hypothetical protein